MSELAPSCGDLNVGRYGWNRSKWIKNPDTGKRERFIRPEAEWQSVARPECASVDDAAFLAVRARIGRRRQAGARREPGHLLTGVLRCAHCGGPLIATDARVYGYAARKDRGPSSGSSTRSRALAEATR
jgi:hypothetical protein